MRPRLAELLGADPTSFALAEPELIRIKPGLRALIRYRAALGGTTLELIGKMRFHALDRRTPALHDALRAAGLDGTAAHGVGVPRIFGTIPELHIWFQEVVPGRLAADYLVPGADVAPSARAGAALATLHLAAVPADRDWTSAQEAEVLARALEAASRAVPSEARRIAAIGAEAEKMLLGLDAARASCIHRDYYPDQVLVGRDRCHILDLDLYRAGDPAIDVGNYLAHIRELALRRHGRGDALDAHAAAFLDGYRSAAPLPDRRRVDVLEAVASCRHVFISTRIADRRNTTRAVLAMCEAQLAMLRARAGRDR